MIKSASQLKGKIKNLSDKDAKKAESYVRLFLWKGFLKGFLCRITDITLS